MQKVPALVRFLVKTHLSDFSGVAHVVVFFQKHTITILFGKCAIFRLFQSHISNICDQPIVAVRNSWKKKLI